MAGWRVATDGERSLYGRVDAGTECDAGAGIFQGAARVYPPGYSLAALPFRTGLLSYFYVGLSRFSFFSSKNICNFIYFYRFLEKGNSP